MALEWSAEALLSGCHGAFKQVDVVELEVGNSSARPLEEVLPRSIGRVEQLHSIELFCEDSWTDVLLDQPPRVVDWDKVLLNRCSIGVTLEHRLCHE